MPPYYQPANSYASYNPRPHGPYQNGGAAPSSTRPGGDSDSPHQQMDGYARARKAVEDARRELEEQRRLEREGKIPKYEPPSTFDYYSHYGQQRNAAAHTPPAAPARPPAVPAFCTQAARPEAGAPVSPPPPDAGSSTPRTGYSSIRNDWAPAASSKAASLWASRSNTCNRSPRDYDVETAPRDHREYISSPRGAVSPRHKNPRSPRGGKRKTFAIDLDETLVHSAFEPCQADLYVPMTMDGQHYTAYVMKRPGVEEFLRKAVENFNVVIWTASLECYAGPVIDELERLSGCGRLKRMFRESCTKQAAGYVKDLRKLLPKGEYSLRDVAILDNSPGVAGLQPRNLIEIANFYDDVNDRALIDMLPLLDRMAGADSVYDVIPQQQQQRW